MKPVAFGPGKVGSMTAYLGHLFLRFPGALGPEKTRNLEFVDTYDRRWLRQGRIWVRSEEELSLVAPPSLLPLDANPAEEFGLWAPVTIGKASARIRHLSFDNPEGPALEGQVVRVRTRTFLILQPGVGARSEAILAALSSEGLEPVPLGSVSWLGSREPAFLEPEPPKTPLGADPADQDLSHRIAFSFAYARRYEAGVRADVDTECLHQYRVHLRRARSLASLGQMWRVEPEWNRLKNVLRTLQQETNDLRDLDVLILGFPEFRAMMPWDEAERLEGWEAGILARRAEEQRRVKGWLESSGYRSLADEVDPLLLTLATVGPGWSVDDLVRSAFERSATGLRKAVRGLDDQSPDEAIHEVRIQSKRLRYTLDDLGSLGPPALVKQLTGILKSAQEGLGTFQDRAVLIQRLEAERLAIRSSRSPGDLLAFGILVGQITAGHHQARTRALADCRILGGKSARVALKKLMGVRGPQASDGV